MFKIRKYILISLLCLIFTGCELYVIGTKKARPIPIDQNSSIGVIYLFKTELDSNNVRGASQILATNQGKYYLAIEKYELFPDLERIQRLIYSKPITDFTTDTLSNTEHQITVRFDYITHINFTTKKINDNWFITKYNESIYYY